jgi:hypothetical protein
MMMMSLTGKSGEYSCAGALKSNLEFCRGFTAVKKIKK